MDKEVDIIVFMVRWATPEVSSGYEYYSTRNRRWEPLDINSEFFKEKMKKRTILWNPGPFNFNENVGITAEKTTLST